MNNNMQASHEFHRVLDAKLVAAVVATGIMSFCGVVVETAMNVAFPALMVEFSVDTATVQWMTTGYLVVLAIVIPASAYLKKRFQTKHLFAFALLLFVVGVLICALASSFWLLLLGRIIQGIGTGIALPLMFNIIIDQTPFEHMGLMIGVGTLVTALAPAVGPSLGGVIIENFGWRSVFLFLLPVLAVALITGLMSIRQATPIDTDTRFDVFSMVCLAAFIIGSIFSLSEATAHLHISLAVVVEALVATAGLVLYIRRSNAIDHPLIELAVFKNRFYALSIAVLMLLQLVILALGYLMPNYAQLVCGAGPAVSGSVMLPGCLLGACLAPVSGRILDRFGAKRPIIFGNVAVVVATSLMFGFNQALTTGLLTGFYMIFTFGSNLTMGNTMTNGLDHLEPALKADGNATINTAQQLAGAIGTALVTGVINAYQAKGGASLQELSAAGGHVSFGLLVLFSLAMLICSLVIFKGVKGKGVTDLDMD